MQLQLEVMSQDSRRDARDLARWLNHEGPEAWVDLDGQPANSVAVRLTSTSTSTSTLIEFAAALLQWLRLRHDDSGTAVRITRADGHVIEVGAGTTRETVSHLAAVLATEPGNTNAISDGATVHGNVVQAREVGTVTVYGPTARHGFGQDAGRTDDAVPVTRSESAALTLPVTIYLSDETIHEQVEAALEELLHLAGLRVERRDDPVYGSWFRRMWARESALVAAHIASNKLVLTQDATITATLLQNLGPVIASLQPTRDAVLRVGALLIVKIDWVLNVHQLTAAQQAVLDLHPHLAASPHEIISTLNQLSAAESTTVEADGRG